MSAPRAGLIPLLVVGGLAMLVAAYGWYRTLTFDRPTGPHHARWHAADGTPVDTSKNHLGDNIMHSAIVLGDRLLVQTSGPRGPNSEVRKPGGYAWIHPASGQAKIAWPLETTNGISVEGIAVRDIDTFALVVRAATETPDGTRDLLLVGIAGRDGWLRPPTEIATWKESRAPGVGGRPLVFGASWIAGELEVVLTHPTGEDPYGTGSPVDVVRVPVRGALVVRAQALGCDCEIQGALPRASGWSLIVEGASPRTRSLVDANGVIHALQPSPEDFDRHQSDRTALGTLWARSGYGANRVELDGSVTQPMPAVPSWKPLIIAERIEWLDGVLRSSRLWSPTTEDISMLAHRVGARTMFAATSGLDLQLVGSSPTTLRPTISDSSSSSFSVGVFLPRADGGYHWVEGTGDYVTLDADLRRIDHQSLWHHLRTRGSTGDFIDEPRHVGYLAWVLFGLPIALLVGFAIAWFTRGRAADGTSPLGLAPLTATCGVYLISGGLMLSRVLPLL